MRPRSLCAERKGCGAMHPPIPISPYAWWLLQLALAVLVVRWASQTLKSVSSGILTVAILIWLMLTVPGFTDKAVRFWQTEIQPRLAEVIRIGGQGVEKGMDGYLDALERGAGSGGR